MSRAFEWVARTARAEELRTAQRLGIYAFCQPFVHDDELHLPTEVSLNGRRVVMFGSNDYLCLTKHKQVKEAAIAAVRKYGTGFSGSRLLNGTSDLHLELEQELAAFLGKPSALVLSTGFQANLAALSSIATKADALILDRESHASLVDGAALSPARKFRFKHNDPSALHAALARCRERRNRIVVVEGVYSMDGSVAPLTPIAEACKAEGAPLLVDDAHGIGVLGEGGRGTSEFYGVTASVDLIVATFSKALGSIGGVIAGPAEVISYIRHCARAAVYSASLPPASAASVLAALKVVRGGEDLRNHLRQISQLLRRALRDAGLEVPDGISPIVPLVLRDGIAVCRVVTRLLEAGYYINPVLKPAAPHDMLRISLTAGHTVEQVEGLAEAIVEAVHAVGVGT